MFSNLLLDSEKKSFLKLLAYLSKVDGDVTQEEIDFIEKVAIELNIKSTDVFNDIDKISLEKICEKFQTSTSKNVVLLELVNLAFADKTYHSSEREGIKVIAGLFDVNEKKLEEIENWVKEGILWSEKGANIINN